MSGWGNLFGKIADQFQGRTERLKNEKERLENEQKKLMLQGASIANVKRFSANDERLREIAKILANATN